MAECQLPRSQDRTRPARPPPPGQSTNLSSYSTFQKNHDKGYKLINKGLSLDEQGHIDEAIDKYQEGLTYIDQVMRANAEELSCSEEEKDSVKQMQQKMTKTKLQIEYRLQSLQAQIMNGTNSVSNGFTSTHVNNGLPSYEEATSTTGSVISDEDFSTLGDSIMSDESQDSFIANAVEIFCVPDGVQIFYITPEGYVSAPSYPTSLKMFKFTDDEVTQSDTASNVPQRPPAFMQVGDWYYPLIPGTSPALRATNGSYIFPDMTQDQQGSAVGLLLPENTSHAERKKFEQMLSSMTALREQHVTPTATPTAPPLESVADAAETTRPEVRIPEKGQERVKDKTVEEEEKEMEDTSTSAKISKGIMIAADWMSWGLGKGAEKASHYIKIGSDKVKAKLQPEENPKQIDPRVQKGIKYARQGADVAVKVSSFLVTKLGQATMAVAREVAPVIRKQGEKILPKSVTESSKDGKSKVDGVVEVAATGLKGFGTVYISLEKAAKALAKNITNETVQIVDHKYGEDASQLTENALYAVGNVAMTAYNAENLGIKAIAKRAAKDTGKAVLQDVNESRKKPQN